MSELDKQVTAVVANLKELEQIKGIIQASGFRPGTREPQTPSQSVTLLVRLLKQSEGECLSLRRRLNELLSYFPGGKPPQSQQPQPSEVRNSADNQSAEGSSSKPEGEDSGYGVGTR